MRTAERRIEQDGSATKALRIQNWCGKAGCQGFVKKLKASIFVVENFGAVWALFFSAKVRTFLLN